jgi:hypothetical protein
MGPEVSIRARLVLGAQSVKTVLYVASVLLVCILSVAAMVWLAGERMNIAPFWVQLLVVPAVASAAFWALRVLLSDEAADE